MAKVTLGGKEVNTSGNLPEVNQTAPDFKLVKTDLSEVSLSDYKGKNIILNIFPSIDTNTCAMSVREFNEKATALDNTVVLCISRDLPFAQARFCGAEGIKNAIPLSNFRDESFGKNYGVTLIDSAMKGLNSRSVVVVNKEGKVSYTELVPEIANEPDYEKALAAVK
ncbi:thiol peroxidase [Marivirga sp. S37H4]|uniref:Thiol peroxidase n=1 Tax=Marivirga aurantiaca TaxID=2802615 RepID=A0A935CAD5_9BACT|nr:thiol peroxidase [Marivirga aurantiaca]MBK6266484.1 thiol peroxidase [Marivirga aurantiaca]